MYVCYLLTLERTRAEILSNYTARQTFEVLARSGEATSEGSNVTMETNDARDYFRDTTAAVRIAKISVGIPSREHTW